MDEFMSYLWPAIFAAAAALIGGAAKFFGSIIKKWAEVHINDEAKKEAAKASVLMVEQVYKALDGPEKFKLAAQNIAELMEQKGIPVTELEITTLVEAAVREFHAGLTEPEIPEPKELHYVTTVGTVEAEEREAGDEEGGSL